MSESRHAELPDTLVGRRVAWLLDAWGTPIQEADVLEHFAPSLLEKWPPPRMLEVLSRHAVLAGASTEELEVTDLEIRCVLVKDDIRVRFDASIEESYPHRIKGFTTTQEDLSVKMLDETPALDRSLAEVVAQHFAIPPERLGPAGFVVGVTHAGSHDVFELGGDADLLYEIGSITKTFTGLLFAEMTGRGEVRTDDPLRSFLPDETQVPGEPEREITLIDLATHTSGLPRLPPNMIEGHDPEDPYAHIDAARILVELAATELEHPIGSTVAYSNYGFGLLGHALAVAGGTSFPELVTSRICVPLGMHRTVFDPQEPGLQQGFHNGRPVKRWTGELTQGAGAGFNSMIGDMLRYADANLTPSDTPLAAAIEEAHKSRHDLDDRWRQAFGWFHVTARDGSSVLTHSGGTAGFRSSLACHQPSKTAVVALCSAGNVDPAPPTMGVLASLINR